MWIILDRSLGVSLLSGRDNMANMDVGAWGRSEVLSQSHSSAAIESDGTHSSYNASYDDGFDFPPTHHPVRELVTFSMFVSGVIALLVWGGWKLLQAIF
jgi:hypothetical protein